MSGIKTLFFSKYPVTPTVVAGIVTDLGTAALFRYEMATGVGDYVETLTSADETGIAYVEQVLNLVLQHILPADLDDINALKQGRWNIFALDYEFNTRAFGLYNGATATGGDSGSGTAPADPKALTMAFTGRENDYAPFLAPPAVPSTPYDPFEDMVLVTVMPAY
jgi:hypothetical protein